MLRDTTQEEDSSEVVLAADVITADVHGVDAHGAAEVEANFRSEGSR